MPDPVHNVAMAQMEMTLYLDIVLNDFDTGDVEPVLQKGEHFELPASVLTHLGVKVRGPQATHTAIDLNMLDGARVHYASAAQKLLLTVPVDWLPAQYFVQSSGIHNQKALASLGGLINYDAYVTQQAGQMAASLWSEGRFFGPFGTVLSTGVAQINVGGVGAGLGKDFSYHRYDTTWRYSSQGTMITAEAGDIMTHAVSWSNTMRLGGVQVSRDFSVRPDIITYPLPQFSGQAAVPTGIDLLIDGVQSMHRTVQPGPYSLSDMPYINGAGNATVVTTDALGRRVETSVPFYVTSTLLKPGYTDYTVAAGLQRQRYGLSDFDYGTPSFSASYRRGMWPFLTLEGHLEAAPHLALGGVGCLTQLGDQFGVVNLAAVESYRSDWKASGARLSHDGQQFVAGYQYTRKQFTVTAQKTWRTAGYFDLSTYNSIFARLPRSSLQANASFNLGRLGSIGLGYFDVMPSVGQRTRFAMLNDTVPLWHNLSLSLSASRQLVTNVSGEGRWSGYAQIVMPFGAYGTVAVGRDIQGASSTDQVSMSHAVGAGDGVGWTANYQHGNHGGAGGGLDYLQGAVTWRGSFAQVQGGVYGAVRSTTRWAEMQGSIAVLDKAVFFGNRVSDAFTVISTDGVGGVPVRYENQLVGVTNSGGHLLVPYATSYYPAKYEIDTLSLPMNIQPQAVEKHVSVKYGSGYLVHFPMMHLQSAVMRLNDPQGNALPVGTLVHAGEERVYVGWDGLLYLPNAHSGETLNAALPNGEQCLATVGVVPVAAGQAHLVPLSCRVVRP